MKKIFLVSIAVLTFFIGFTNVKAEGEVSVDLKIYENGAEIFDESILVSPCLLPGASEEDVPNVSAYCAVEQSGVDASWSQFGSDWYLDSVDGTGADFSQNLYWAVFYDLEYAVDSMSAHILEDGEEILLAYNSYPLKIEGDNSPAINETAIFTVYQFGLDESFNPTWVLQQGATVFLDGVEFGITNESGEILIPIDSAEEKTLTATAENTTPSAPFDFEGEFPKVDVDLVIATNSEIIFDGEVSFTPCENGEVGGEITYNAYCALQEVVDDENLTLDASWSDFGVFVNGIESYSSDFANNLFWATFLNRAPMDVSLNNQIVSSGDEIILSYGTSPLKITSSNNTPIVGETVQIVGEFFDSNSWAYVPAINGVFVVNGIEIAPEADGVYDLLVDTNEPYNIFLKLLPYVESLEIVVDGIVSTDNGGGSGGENTEEENDFDVDQAVSFLLSNQEENGSFGGDLYTDWVAIALASSGDAPENLKNYLISDTNPGSILQDLARRAMALMALGVDPREGTERNYISDILEEFDGTQFGDDDIWNDDLFAVLVLLKAGADEGGEEITKAVEFILSAQEDNGAFIGIDLTSATVQILSLVDDLPGVDDALENASVYLRSSQSSNGGFGNSFATSWALQAIGAFGDTPSDWERDGISPIDYLATLQESDGGVGENSDGATNRIWATSYAIPGALGIPWGEILEDFEIEENTDEGVGGNQNDENISEENVGEVLGVETSLEEVVPVVVQKEEAKIYKIAQTKNIEKKVDVVIEDKDESTLDPVVAPTPSGPKSSSRGALIVFIGLVIIGIVTFFRKK
jgi:hypothetical protein